MHGSRGDAGEDTVCISGIAAVGLRPACFEPARYIQRCTSSSDRAPTAFPKAVPEIAVSLPDPAPVHARGCYECWTLSYQGGPGCCPCSVLDARTHLTARPSETFVQEATALVQSKHESTSAQLLQCEWVE